MDEQEKLTKQIKELSDSIKKKTQALKTNISEREAFLESTFKPVVGPLKEISKKLTTPEIENEEIMPKIKSDETIMDQQIESDSDMSDSMETETSLIEPYTPSRLSLVGRDIRQKGLLTRKYVVKMLHSTVPKRKYHVFGARLDDEEGLVIGNSKVSIDESDNLLINNNLFKGTPGLFELLFTTDPKKYTSNDLQIYKQILLLTNAHKKNYMNDLPIHQNTSVKYKKIISKLFPQKTTSISSPSGKGLNLKSAYDTNIVYYNDVNKLVNRLRLLYEAKEAGHTGVDSEIKALTKELQTNGYIK